MSASFKNRIYRPKTFYHSQIVKSKASNRNKVPKIIAFKHVIKISLIVGPLLALLLWLY